MNWTDFLIHVLRAHAQTLHRLAAFLGESELLELLESAGDSPESCQDPLILKEEWLTPSLNSSSNISTAYLELEGAVQDMHLPSVLEFHLWAYPFYRLFIESSIDLKAKIPNSGQSEVLEKLVEEAVFQAQNWVKSLKVRPEFYPQIASIAQLPWIRFRTTILGKIGRRPIAALN